MKKKLICLLLTAVMLFSLAACTFVEPENKQTEAPTNAPTNAPTDAPTDAPTEAPTAAPTEAADETPTEAPTTAPTNAPVTKPTVAPTEAPTAAPTAAPTEAPTEAPAEDTYVAPRNYEEYLAMSREYQIRFKESFSSLSDFVTWLNDARQAYEASQEKSEVGSDGIIDLG